MSAVGRLERLWGNQIKYIFFWLAVSCNDLTTVLRQRSWRTCIPLSQSLSRRPTTDKEPEDYGLDIDFNQLESLPTKTVMTGRHKGGYRAPVILVPGVARVGPDRGKAACKVAMEPDSTTEAPKRPITLVEDQWAEGQREGKGERKTGRRHAKRWVWGGRESCDLGRSSSALRKLYEEEGIIGASLRARARSAAWRLVFALSNLNHLTNLLTI